MSNIRGALKSDLRTFYEYKSTHVIKKEYIPGAFGGFILNYNNTICKYCNSKNSFKNNVCTQCGAHS